MSHRLTNSFVPKILPLTLFSAKIWREFSATGSNTFDAHVTLFGTGQSFRHHTFQRPPYGLRRSPIMGVARVTVFMVGVLGSTIVGWAGCFAGQPIRPNVLRNWAVFAAAPTSLTFTEPDILTLSSLKAPPPYSNTTLLNEHPVHVIPSGRYVLPFIVEFDSTTFGGSTTGTAPPTSTWANAECRNVEVWGLPSPDSEVQTTPNTNDPNAMVTFLITPPSSGVTGDCTEWEYHNGGPPQ